MEKRFPSADRDGFVPARLTIARNARGLKQIELAESIRRAPATLSKWENNTYDQAPDSQTVLLLANTLAVDIGWFYKPIRTSEGVAFFRSLKSELFLARDRASARLRFVDDIFSALSDRVEFPEVDIPDLVDGRNFKTLRAEDIDDIANRLRDYWMLGDDPIDDLMVVIENAGVAVAEDYVQSSKLDGVSRWFDKHPVMLLAKDKQGAVRRRFDAAHELGHLVLHQSMKEEDLRQNIGLIEEQAMIFAGALLLPASSFSSDVHDITLDSLADIKPRWKVSIGAMIKRLGVLNLVNPDHERNLWKYYSYRKWRGNEPYDDRLEIEHPINLKEALEMIAEDGINELSAVVSEIGLFPEDIAELTGADLNLLRTQKLAKPKLKLVRKNGLGVTTIKAAND